MTLENPFQPPEIEQEAPEEAPKRPYTPAEGLDPEAPYGWIIDRKTGDRRPKKRAGRVKIHQETEPAEPAEPKPDREPDRVPGRVRPETKRRGRPSRTPKPAPEPLPAFRAGPIAKSVNRLYLRAGKLIRAMDPDIGTAIISMTRKELDEDGRPIEDDITVGEAWEEVARLNPRIRAMLMKLISGGAWSQLVMVHAPLLLAILMKESIARRLPLMNMLASFLSDEDEPAAEAGAPAAGLFSGLTQEDVAQAMAAFNQFMPGAASQMSPGMNGYATVMERNGTQRPATAEDFGLGDATP